MKKLSMLLLALTLVLTACGGNDNKTEDTKGEKTATTEQKPQKIGGEKTGEGDVNLYGPGSNTEENGKMNVEKDFSDFSISSRNIPTDTTYELYSNGEKVDYDLKGDVDDTVEIKNLKSGENFIEVIGKKDNKVVYYRELIVNMK